MRKTLLALAATLAVLLPVLPVAAQEDTDVEHIPCPPATGRELLTPDGWEVTVNGAAAIPDPGAVRDATDDRLTPFRNGWFAFQAAFGAAERANAQFTLSWGDPVSDYDLWVVDEDGFPLTISQDVNPETGEAVEQASLQLATCERFQVYVRNYAGSPGEELTLGITVDPIGEVGDPVTDERQRFYLGGDPGQVSMTYDTAGTDRPRSALTDERPSDGAWNTYTRPVVGFRDQHRNPFLSHWAARFDDQPEITGHASAVVWVSSPTLQQGGTLIADLYLDGGIVSQVEIPGEEISETPAPLFINFGEVDSGFPVFEADIQLGTEPAVSSADPGDPADALYTVWYDSVQFPSVLILP